MTALEAFETIRKDYLENLDKARDYKKQKIQQIKEMLKDQFEKDLTEQILKNDGTLEWEIRFAYNYVVQDIYKTVEEFFEFMKHHIFAPKGFVIVNRTLDRVHYKQFGATTFVVYRVQPIL